MADDITPQSEASGDGESDQDHPKVLHIDTERGLVQHRKAIAARLQAHPSAMRMLIINPVMAFKDAGVVLSPAVANHVLHAIQYPPDVRAERTRLEDGLKATLGRQARPTEPKWLAGTVFGQLGVAPVEIGDTEPVYCSTFDGKTLTELGALLPTRGLVTGTAAAPPAPAPSGSSEPDDTSTSVGIAPAAPERFSFEPKTVQLLDLDAPVPQLPPAATAPAELSLTDLWFYKDAAPPVRSLLSLGIIMNSGVAIYSSSQYRKIRDGVAQSELLSWITSVQIPARSR